MNIIRKNNNYFKKSSRKTINIEIFLKYIYYINIKKPTLYISNFPSYFFDGLVKVKDLMLLMLLQKLSKKIVFRFFLVQTNKLECVCVL